jgi:hypothetical protein
MAMTKEWTICNHHVPQTRLEERRVGLDREGKPIYVLVRVEPQGKITFAEPLRRRLKEGDD